MPPCSPAPALHPAMPRTASPKPVRGRTASLLPTRRQVPPSTHPCGVCAFRTSFSTINPRAISEPMRLCGRIRSLMAKSSRQRTMQRYNAQSNPTAHAPPSALLMAQPSQRGALHAHPRTSSRRLTMPIIRLMSSCVNCEQFNIRTTRLWAS